MPVSVTRFLSRALGGEPARYGIALDDDGWTDVEALVAACTAHGVAITRAELEQIVASNSGHGLSLSEDGTRIRATRDRHGKLVQATPPEVLYCGASYRALPAIHERGLSRGQYVRLSPTASSAADAGRPIVLTVRAAAMAGAGFAFYRGANDAWLVENVPVEYIDFPVAREHGVISNAPRASIAKQTLAACEAGCYENALGARVELAAAIAAARDDTTLHELGVDELALAQQRFDTQIAVTSETTIAALCRLAAAPGGHLACLNFASARNPGGGFLGGAQAQEESLARSSALYLCQCARRAFYDRNRAQRSALYLDLALFSPRVPVFRDDDGAWLDAPVLASMITCPAPNAGALRQQGELDRSALEATLRRRAGFVLAIASHHGVERLVLGAWGAGVFGNDPVMVASVFRDWLSGDYAGVFAEIVFAVVGDRERPNHRAFADAFGT